MKKTYKYLALAALVTGFAACSQEDDFAPQQSDIVQIASAYIATEVQTRVNTYGAGDTFENTDEILLVNNTRTDKNEGTYTYNGSEWSPNTTGGMVLWASGSNQFTAYYPANETFELPTDQSDLTKLKSADRMKATATVNKDDALNLKFEHQNAKVTINTVFASQYGANATISDLAIGGITPYNPAANSYTAILEPTEDGFTVTLKVNSTDELTATSRTALEKGKHYTFTLSVGKSVVTLSTVSVEEWGTTDPLTGGEATELQMTTYTIAEGIAVITVPENVLASSFTSAVEEVASASNVTTIIVNGTLTEAQQSELATALSSFTGTLVLDMKQDAVTDASLKTLVDVYEGRTIEEADEVTTYQVYTANGLYAWNKAAQNDLSTNLTLMADITLPNKDLTTGANITVTDGKPSGSNWTPVGTSSSYKGNIDGSGKTITGLHINSTSLEAGFVGRYAGSEIKNLHLGNGVVYSTTNAVGGIAGKLVGGTITDCENHATISGKFYVGGIVGIVIYGDVTGCTNTGNVTGSWSVGGIVGNGQRYSKGGPDNDNVISGCVNSGTVTGGGTDTGGIIGIINSNMYTVIACVNTGEVVNGGGIVGENGGKVVASYTTQNSVAVNNEVGKDTNYHHIGSIEATYYLGEDDSIDGTTTVSELNSEEVVNTMNEAISTWQDYDGNACAYKWQIGTTYPGLVANTAN